MVESGKYHQPAANTTAFLSYAHDGERHKKDVCRLANLLAKKGIEVEFDMWRTNVRRDWYAWALRSIQAVDFILVVASAKYKSAGDGFGRFDTSRGVQAEAAAVRDLLYRDRNTWTKKLLPVVLPGSSLDDLPLFVQPYSATHFKVESLDDSGIDELVRFMSHDRSKSAIMQGNIRHLLDSRDELDMPVLAGRASKGYPLSKRAAPLVKDSDGALAAIAAMPPTPLPDILIEMLELESVERQRCHNGSLTQFVVSSVELSYQLRLHGEYRSARDFASSAYRTAIALDSDTLRCVAAHCLAEVLKGLNKRRRAELLVMEALEAPNSSKEWRATCYVNLAKLAVADDHTFARRMANDAYQLRKDMSPCLGLGISYGLMADIECIGQAAGKDAIQLAKDSLDVMASIGHRRGTARGHLRIARLLHAAGTQSLDDALNELEEAIRDAKGVNARDVLAEALVEGGDIETTRGRLNDAGSYYTQAALVATPLGRPNLLAKVKRRQHWRN